MQPQQSLNRLAFSATTPDEIAEGTRRLGLLLTGAAS